MHSYIKTALLLIAASAMLQTTQAQDTRTLSPHAIVSLMTVAPGAEVYSTYGHTALRVYDPSQNVDRIYNYGTFDFDQPNFLLKFCRGKLNYMLDIERYKSFERGNLLDGRGMTEQVLHLSQAQSERLFNLLETNAQPDNRNYKYDFFYDNCATRIRDAVDNALYGQVSYDSAVAETRVTMRQLLRPYLIEHPWMGFGIDLVLGMPTDKQAGPRHYTFLPDHLHDAFAHARLGEGQPLIRQEYRTPSDFVPERKPAKVPSLPIIVTALVAFVGFLCMYNPKANRVFDAIFWTTLGIGGCIVAFLWFFTDHQATKNNLNLFWLWPTHLLVGFRRRRGGLWESYFLVAALMAGVLLLGMKWLPQELPLAAIPLMLLIVVKGFWKGKQTLQGAA
jgi:hypothetical protein